MQEVGNLFRSNPKDHVTIVISVYNAIEETISCINSILQSDGSECRIVVNDDGSPVYVGQRLRAEFSGVSNVEISTSFRNRGYTATIQYGIDFCETRYVAIVNSDTLFPRKWLGKLVATLDDNRALAAVGPLSNAASYQSIPLLMNTGGDFSSNDNFGLGEYDREVVNEFLHAFFPKRISDTPILNGFCTLFRTRALLEIGGFDVANFPTGYGEENDVCMRLLAAGHRLGIQLDCFVHHLKSRSFGNEKKKEYSRNGRKALARIYGEDFVPEYAKIMDENNVLASVRFAVQSAYGSELKTDLSSSPFPVDEEKELKALGSPIVIDGPVTAIIWPDRHIVDTLDSDTAEIAFSVGSGYLLVHVPEGKSITLSSRSPIPTALAFLSVLSHFETVRVRQMHSGAKTSILEHCRDKLGFRLLFVDEDWG